MKYRTPQINEFVDGFKYEVRTYVGQSNSKRCFFEWKEYVYPNKPKTLSTLEDRIHHKSIRTYEKIS